MKQLITGMIADEDGAVTVDWVVLTAAVLGLGLYVGITFGGITHQAATDVAGTINTIQAQTDD